jgi:hypothetical protein
MKENKTSKYGRFLFYLLFMLWVASAIFNINRGYVNNPSAFVVSIVGFIFFIIAKLSIIPKQKISFGTAKMSEGMANLYRVGYWLMVVGVLITFT